MPLLPAFSLARRELVRFLRQRSRVTGALVTPIVFWLLIGFGVGKSFNAGSGGYQAYFFPGTILMIVLFTAIFSTISVIEDRREGFLQGVLVAPVSRLNIVMGKVLGGATLATVQALLFLIAAPLVGVALSPSVVVESFAAIVVMSIGITGLGFLIAWPMGSTQGFHAIMNLLLMPMWFLSGALFPVTDSTPLPMKALIYANPMTYCLSTLRHAMHVPAGVMPGVALSVAVMVLFTIAMIGASCAVAMRPGKVVVS
ncbi:MAG: ABC transporter permease [Tepidisphaeraceae bacterium]